MRTKLRRSELTCFLEGTASWTPSLACTESCPDCCRWSKTQSLTSAMATSSCCCSGCCWLRCRPAKNQHHLLKTDITFIKVRLQFSLNQIRIDFLLAFFSKDEITENTSMIEIDSSASPSGPLEKKKNLLTSEIKFYGLPFLSLLRVTTLGWFMEISISGGLISAIFISSSSESSSVS